jgi:hypothetical protein
MPDDNVVSFINRGLISLKLEPDQLIIDQLKKMLAQAESGQMQAIFVVGWLTDNSIMSGWQGADRAAFTLLGGVHQCLNEYVLKEFQRRF